MTEDQIAEMRAMRRSGYTDAQIASQFKISRQAVHYRLGPVPGEDRRHTIRVNFPSEALNSEALAAERLPHELTAWRARNSLTQAQAAEVFHLAYSSTYAKWEQGKGCSVPGLVIAYAHLWEKEKNAVDKR